jgi:hypothetical protein
MFGPKRYVVLGHSVISKNNTNKTVPEKVHLVFLGQCGHSYSRDHVHGPIFKSRSRTTNFLHSKNVNFYEPGAHYRNQVIEMPRLNREKLMHGIYKLPVNMLRKNLPKRRNAWFNTRPRNGSNLSGGQEEKALSNILNNISKKGGGTVIGVFCRGLGNVTKSNVTGGPTKSVNWKRHRAVKVESNAGTRYLSPRGGVSKFKTLRSIGPRKNFLKAIRESENIRPVPGPSGSHARTRFLGLLKKL